MAKCRQNYNSLTKRLAAIALVALVGALPALGQDWRWPWEDDRPPRPSAPLYRDRAPGPTPPSSFTGRRSAICLQLEQRLAQEANRGIHTRARLPEILKGIREARQKLRVGQARLERFDCYQTVFLFTRRLRGTRRCIALSRQVEQAQRTLATLEAQRQQANSGYSPSLRRDIVRELAANNCGETYRREAQKFSNPFSSIWQDEGGIGGGANRFGELPFATYRTICVRLCDGYYFPVSFSTLPNHFNRDAEACQARCAAPSALYYHQNPGAGVDQAVSHRTKEPYKTLKTAFKYRKEFIKGCSCKTSEYAPPDGSAKPGAPGASPPGAPQFGTRLPNSQPRKPYFGPPRR